MKKQLVIAGILLAVFLTAYFLPVANPKVQAAIVEACKMTQWYAVYHTLACVVPAIFIAGAIATFLDKTMILRYLGPRAKPAAAYGVASVSGTILAVCSCSVLPMFAGIYRIGAGLGPAATFLFAGPALNVMAIFLTARVLGWELGVARTLAAIVGSIGVGLLMSAMFRRSETSRVEAVMQLPDPPESRRKLWQTGLAIGVMVLFLVFSDWVNPGTKYVTFTPDPSVKQVTLDVSILQQTRGDMTVQVQTTCGNYAAGDRFVIRTEQVESMTDNVPPAYRWAAQVFHVRWYLAFSCFAILLMILWKWFDREEIRDWMEQSWRFGKTIVPLLFGGVFVTGFVSTLIPAEVVASWVGGNSVSANVSASLIGTLWYFATLTEIPCMQALLGLGMGKGPALALLIAGPTLSLPSILVIGRYLGLKKTAVFVLLVVFFSTLIGLTFGTFF